MKVHYECASCFLRQAREALDLATEDIDLKMKISKQINQILCNEFKEGAVANEIGTKIHRTIKKQTGNQDPYHDQREKSDQIALKLLPQVTKILEKNGNLESYLKASIAGNLLDFAALGLNLDFEDMIIPTLEKDLSIKDSYELEQQLKKAKNVLYLADNVGEIVFDKLLIQKLLEYGVEVTVALKEEPILNDACMKDALDVGLDELAHLTTIGTDSVGIIYDDLSEEFKQKFKDADLIIAKGLGNYEGLDEMQLGNKPIFCLLNAKCEPIAKDIGVKKGDNVVLMFNPVVNKSKN
jgi:hypothetical protein